MIVFVSWSGDPSRQAAELMRDWLPNVLQDVDVWVSSQDINKGDRWSAVLGQRLAEIQFGMLMVTKSNVRAPWIMFEAGALSKSLGAKLIPILCDIKHIDIGGTPLSQFQAAVVAKDEIFSVVAAANLTRERPLDGHRLKLTFEKWWPEFEASFAKIDFPDEDKAHPERKRTATDERLQRLEDGVDAILRSLARPRTEPVIVPSKVVYRKPSTEPPKVAEAMSTLLNLGKTKEFEGDDLKNFMEAYSILRSSVPPSVLDKLMNELHPEVRSLFTGR